MRHKRVRKKVKGDNDRPRLTVFKSSRHMYAQVIDDENSKTLTGISTLSPKFREKQQGGGHIAAARIIGELIAKEALNKGIKKVIFDRGGYPFHGRVKALAESAREGGLEF
ncbi:MAG: 50S ribosomal protein L18 [Thermoplasmata archaeon]|nr:MAG: 50S ribosomal protein L18 [Thermoplasmata archaeon]